MFQKQCNTEEEIVVSVCCLTYNHEKYIEQTMKGFVNQITNFKYEIIVHDDNSSDGTKDIVKRYAEKYPDLFVLIFQKENQYSKGINISGNFLFPSARGKFIAICEGDDYWNDSYKLQKQYDALMKHSECSICTHKVQCINEDGSINKRIIPEAFYGINNTMTVKQDLFAKFLFCKGGYPFHTSSYFFRKEIVQPQCEGKAEFTNFINGDMSIMFFSLRNGNCYYIDEPMSCRRLFSLDNWNSRFIAKSVKEKAVYFQANARGSISFDQWSNYQFHSYIYRAVAGNILLWCQYDVDTAKSMFREYKINTIGLIKTGDVKLIIKFWCFKFFPRLYGKIRDIAGKSIK